MTLDWTPITLAKLSVGLMAIPVTAIVSVLLISILMSVFLRLTNTPTNSPLGKKLESIGGSIFYVAFIGVAFMQLMFVGLMISGAWYVINWIVSLL